MKLLSLNILVLSIVLVYHQAEATFPFFSSFGLGTPTPTYQPTNQPNYPTPGCNANYPDRSNEHQQLQHSNQQSHQTTDTTASDSNENDNTAKTVNAIFVAPQPSGATGASGGGNGAGGTAKAKAQSSSVAKS